MKWNARTVHREVAYFYVGLIISFSLSGIFLNHRQSWFPTNYVYETRPVSITMPDSADAIDAEFVDQLASELNIEDVFKGFRVRGDRLRVTYENTTLEVDVNTGAGDIEEFFAVPLLSQMTQLHVSTHKGWIYYSDVFGIGMLVIACTGMFIQRGSLSFRQRGWKLALLGILFPLVFLFLLS